MDKGKDLQGFSRILDDREEYLVDRDRGVCDPFLSVGIVSVSKERLWQYNSQGNDILNACKSFLYHFVVEQTLHFFEFAEWCAVNYSSSQRVIVCRIPTEHQLFNLFKTDDGTICWVTVCRSGFTLLYQKNP